MQTKIDGVLPPRICDVGFVGVVFGKCVEPFGEVSRHVNRVDVANVAMTSARNLPGNL